jgi:hypothetical protein
MWSSMRAHIAVLVAITAAASGCGGAGTEPGFVEISAVAETPTPHLRWPDASTGTVTIDCGRNERGHRNADNFITRPGETDGAHHMHDYVGNVSTDARSTDASLAAAETTCVNGDQSTYFWPVLRLHGSGHAHTGDGGNTGTIVEPAFVELRFSGNPASDVVAMPRFLRIVTGDARAVTNGGANGVARWSCSQHPDRFTSNYPLCPAREQVVRTFDFPNCWDGRNTDSENHRSHVVFPNSNGECPRATFPVPHLVLRVGYDVPAGPSYQIDSFPDQRNSSATDHGDFTNVMTDELMSRVVRCVNQGLSC